MSMADSPKLLEMNQAQIEAARPRLERIARQHNAGRTVAEIARIEQITRARVYQLLAKAKKHGIA